MKNKDTFFNARAAIGFILHKISDFNYEPIKDYLDNLDADVEAVKLRFGLGFTHKKVYLDLLEIYYKDRWNGHLTLYTLLHEIGHTLRIKENEDLLNILETDDFEVYFNNVLIEEAAAHEYAVNQFKLLTGVELNEGLEASMPDINSDSFREVMMQVFNKKQNFDSFAEFGESLIDRDFVFKTKDLSWNQYPDEERHIRACIAGSYYNPFNIPKDSDMVMFNASTFEGTRFDESTMDDYNEKDVMIMNPFNSKYISKVSYENGKVVEAFRVEDNEWVSVDLNTL